MSDTRSRVRGAIEAILVDEHGPGALTRRPIRSGSTMNLTDPTDYRQGIDAAQRVIGTAEAIIRDYAKRARGNGRSWADIAQALGMTSDDHQDPVVAAFRWVAPTPSQPFDRIITAWECASCGAWVTDHGPFSGHPEDDESGHDEGCARHAADVQEYRRQTGWDEE